MYTLTLTREERRAFDWVAHRYHNGSDMSDLLWCECDISPVDVECWSDGDDVTFSIPEHVAWQIHDLAGQDDYTWPCFAPELAAKMQRFIDSIV